MKRKKITLHDVADLKTLCLAAYRAAKGKRDRHQVASFFAEFDAEIERLQQGILEGTIPVGRTTEFQIFDPKPRRIHAPVFPERVLHHAVIGHVGPVLDRALIDDTFACRVGKGAIAAVRRARQHCQRFPWYAKIDVRQYFPSVDHEALFQLVCRKVKDDDLLHLIWRIIRAHESSPGVGLPIGALTSQHFANFYLNGHDRFLLRDPSVLGLVRYMDDTVFWCPSKETAQNMVARSREFLAARLNLRLHPRAQINRSSHGVTFCGFRVFSGSIRLTLRRRRLYAAARARWERRYAAGEISANQLQNGYAAALGIILHADSDAWRGNQLSRVSPLEACDWN